MIFHENCYTLSPETETLRNSPSEVIFFLNFLYGASLNGFTTNDLECFIRVYIQQSVDFIFFFFFFAFHLEV